MLRLNGFELDGNFFARDDVGAKVDIAEGTGTNLAANTVLVTDAEILQEISLDRSIHTWVFKLERRDESVERSLVAPAKSPKDALPTHTDIPSLLDIMIARTIPQHV